MTDVVTTTLQEAPPQAVEHTEVVRLSMTDQDCVAKALLTSPPPCPALECAYSRRRRLLGSE